MPPGLKLTDEESPLRWPLYVPAGQSRKSLHPADITTRLVSPQLRVAAARVKGLHCITVTSCFPSAFVTTCCNSIGSPGSAVPIRTYPKRR